MALNRTVAVGERDGPAAGLAALAAIDKPVRSHLWHAALAEALRRLGDLEQARAELARAVRLAPTGPERRLLTGRIDALTGRA